MQTAGRIAFALQMFAEFGSTARKPESVEAVVSFLGQGLQDNHEQADGSRG